MKTIHFAYDTIDFDEIIWLFSKVVEKLDRKLLRNCNIELIADGIETTREIERDSKANGLSITPDSKIRSIIDLKTTVPIAELESN